MVYVTVKWHFYIILFSFCMMNSNRLNAQVDKNYPSNEHLNEKVEKILKSPEDAEKYLAIRIFPELLFSDSLKNGFIYKNDFEGLISVLTINLDEGVKIVNKHEVEHWGLSINELFQKAKNSLSKNIEDLEFEKIELNEKTNCLVAWDEQNYFMSSSLYFPNLFAKFDNPESGIIVGLPARHVFSLMPIKSKSTLLDDLQSYYYFLSEVYHNEPNPLTLNIYLYKSGEFSLISPVFNQRNELVTFIVPNK
ncbi:MAG: hypothetical protein ACO1O6_11130 [Bacteroidota bacterium]